MKICSHEGCNEKHYAKELCLTHYTKEQYKLPKRKQCLETYNKSSKGKKNRKKHALKRLYGITLEQYNEISEKQGGKCAICGNPETCKSKNDKIRILVVDHDHKTNKIRGLLCHTCNIMLGHAKDNKLILQNAIKYLN